MIEQGPQISTCKISKIFEVVESLKAKGSFFFALLYDKYHIDMVFEQKQKSIEISIHAIFHQKDVSVYCATHWHPS